MDHTVCPGSKFIRQPKPEQFPCPSCGAEVEIWSDEISGKCSACGATAVRDGTMNCIEWCAMARDCVGDDAFNNFQEHKATTIKERLLELATIAATDAAANSVSEPGISLHYIERSIFYAENIARSEEAGLHIVLTGAVLGSIFGNNPELARKELLRMGFQLDDIEEVCSIIASPPGGVGEVSVNESVVHDAHLLAALEEQSSAGFAGNPDNDPEQIRFRLKTKSGTELIRHVTA